MTRYTITVNNTTNKFYRIAPIIARINEACAQVFGSLRRPFTLTIILVTETKMKSLKKYYHGKNMVTDVLSFPTADGLYRGEIVVCPVYLEKQARVRKEPLDVLLSHTIVHGILHLEGYHHEASIQAEKKCLKKEEQILAVLGIEHTENQNVKIKMKN